MTSTTGRIPCIAAPIPEPTSAISEIGVLRTRSEPNSSSIPCVTPIEPPISAMSSPMMKTSSLRIACASASRTASRYESSGIDVSERVLGLGIGAVFREFDRAFNELLDLAVLGLELLVGDAELFAEQREGIARLLELAGVPLAAIALRI